MCPVSRLAVGTLQPGADRHCMVGALYGVLARAGLQVQPFLSRACFCCDETSILARQAPRHLDSWLMSREVCEELFLRGARSTDLALVEGELPSRSALDHWYAAVLDSSLADEPRTQGASLETLCQWLDLPAIAVIDVSAISGCRMPIRPERVGGVLLDRVGSRAESHRWRTLFESLWDVPVLGALDDAYHLRTMMGASDSRRSREGVLRALTDRLAENLDIPGLMRVAEQRPLYALTAEGLCGEATRAHGATSQVKVAVAYDDAFHCYFQDTLDLLEARGATICVFSPLRDESLPPDVDVVYLGCGCPEKLADPLSENHCMKQALRSFVEEGGRVYAEVGGLAYLCQQVVLPTGRRLPMVGALPAIAVRTKQPQPPQPAEVTLRDDNWLAECGSRLRGYLNTNWRIQPVGPLTGLAKEESLHTSLVGRQNVIGSRMHLNFAAQPSFLRRFFQPVPFAGHTAER